MIFYEINLKSLPKITFALSVDLAGYKNTFLKYKNFLEMCVIEEGTILVKNPDGSEELVEPKTIASVFSDTECEMSAFNNQRQRHTTVGVSVDYELVRHSSDEKIDLAELKRRVKSENIMLIPFRESADKNFAEILSQIKKIIALTASAEPSAAVMAISEWFSLCGVLTRTVLERLEKCAYVGYPPSALRYVEKAEDYIHLHYRENISVSNVAEHLGISVGYLHALFKDCLSVGVGEYINRYRIEEAKKYILMRNVSLEQVSALVGISDPSYMSRLFKKVCGVSYREYKNSSVQNADVQNSNKTF